MCSSGVDAARLHCRLVHRRDVPEDEVRGPDRERDERVREHAQAHDARKREHGAEERPGEPREQAERREVADEQVLRHVEREELLLADLRDRRGDRDQQQRDPEREEPDPPPGNGLPALRQRPRAHRRTRSRRSAIGAS